MRISIIGLGLIGGSMAIDLKKNGFATHIIGVDNNKLHAQTALQIGIIDEILEMDEAIKNCELIILAIPADATIRLLPKILDKVNKQIVTDVCSVKGLICERVKYHNKRMNYVASHPMAGTENSGPWAALSGLFDGKAVIICDAEDSADHSIHLIKDMYAALHMRHIYMNSYNHDTHAAYVSHISHISSFALSLTVLDKENNERNIFNLASGGFGSSVRLAKSSAEMWTPIFSNNSENVIAVLNAYILQLLEFKTAIENKDKEQLNHLITNANKIKKVLSNHS